MNELSGMARELAILVPLLVGLPITMGVVAGLGYLVVTKPEDRELSQVFGAGIFALFGFAAGTAIAWIAIKAGMIP